MRLRVKFTAAQSHAVLQLPVAVRLLGLEAVEVFEEESQENGDEERDNHRKDAYESSLGLCFLIHVRSKTGILEER